MDSKFELQFVILAFILVPVSILFKLLLKLFSVILFLRDNCIFLEVYVFKTYVQIAIYSFIYIYTCIYMNIYIYIYINIYVNISYLQTVLVINRFFFFVHTSSYFIYYRAICTSVYYYGPPLYRKYKHFLYFGNFLAPTFSNKDSFVLV